MLLSLTLPEFKGIGVLLNKISVGIIGDSFVRLRIDHRANPTR
jgi:hypothetical protein